MVSQLESIDRFNCWHGETILNNKVDMAHKRKRKLPTVKKGHQNGNFCIKIRVNASKQG
jgi:hypothetical protein